MGDSKWLEQILTWSPEERNKNKEEEEEEKKIKSFIAVINRLF